LKPSRGELQRVVVVLGRGWPMAVGDVLGLGEPSLAPARFSVTNLELLLWSTSSSCSTTEAQTAGAEFPPNIAIFGPLKKVHTLLLFS
jgi:hypothetical protein